MPNYEDQFTSQADSYIKFILYHTIIVFTVVFSLLSAVNNVQCDDIKEKANKAISLEKESGYPCNTLVSDDLLKKMYFPPSANLEYKYTDTNSLIPASEKAAALESQQQLLKDIETAYTKAFIFKLSFLGDVLVDMRNWIFILPVVMMLSLIYIFILDYKIETVVCIAEEKGETVSITKQYPFRFLRPVFYFIELILLIVYSYVLNMFLASAEEDFSRSVITGYIIMLYYSLLYCRYLYYKLNATTGLQVTASFNKPYVWMKLRVKNLLLKIAPVLYLRTGQLLLFATLSMIMCYSSCGSTTTAIKGYELIITLKKWEMDWVDGVFINWFLKYLYAAVLIFTLLLLFTSFHKGIRKLHEWVIVFFFFATFTFTVYFGMYNILFSYLSLVGVAIMTMLWYFLIFKRLKDAYMFGLKQLWHCFIFLFPFLCFALHNSIAVYSAVNGWFWFFSGLWIVLTGLVLIFRKSTFQLPI